MSRSPFITNRADANIEHAGIFGRRKSGKTTLAKVRASEFFKRDGWFSLVCDPNREAWGPHAWVTEDRDAWLAKLNASRNCNCVVDEAGMTIKRDRELVDLFTRIGHRGHRLTVIGHGGANLLPRMREQLTELFLFRLARSEAEMWAELFTDERIMQACDLDFQRREFLHAKLGGDVRRCVLSL